MAIGMLLENTTSMTEYNYLLEHVIQHVKGQSKLRLNQTTLNRINSSEMIQLLGKGDIINCIPYLTIEIADLPDNHFETVP